MACTRIGSSIIRRNLIPGGVLWIDGGQTGIGVTKEQLSGSEAGWKG